MRSGAIALACIAALCSCAGEEAPKAAVAAAVPAPAEVRREPVRADPRLVALAERRDPDLEAEITPEEVEATLAAATADERRAQKEEARRRAAERLAFDGARDPYGAGSRAPTEWEILEMEKEFEEEMESVVEGVIVVAGPDGRFHVDGCASLYVDSDADEEGRRYMGSTVTFGAAKKKGMSGHADCGANQVEQW